MSSGEQFGSAYDPLGGSARRVVIPDLLGFGASLDPAEHDFGLGAHLDALDAMAKDLNLDGPLTVGGHSMGGTLALHWAARHARRVQQVVTWSAPLYRDATEGRHQLRHLGFLEHLFASETALARAVCAWSCRHRDLAGWLSAAIAPRLPLPLARRTPLHTWAAYQGALEEIILDGSWVDALARVSSHDVPVILAAGARDPVPIPGRNQELAGMYERAQERVHPSADHELPLRDAAWARGLITSAA